MAGSAEYSTERNEKSWLRPVYRTVLENYREGLTADGFGRFDRDIEEPALLVAESEKGYDLEDNLIYVDPEVFRPQSFEQLSQRFMEDISYLHSVHVHSEALTERTEEAVQWLEDVYGVDLDFNEAYFRDLPGNTLAKSRRSDREFRLDTDYMENFDWYTRSFENDDPVNSIEGQVERLNTLLEEGRSSLESRVSKVGSAPLHEARHWLSYELHEPNLEFKINRPDIEELSGQDRGWGQDITVTPLEIGTTFDQFLYGYNGKKRRKQPLKAFHDPLENPEFFEGRNDLLSGHEKSGIRSPYNLGLFLGLAKYHMEKQDKPDTEALENARNYALELTADTEELENHLGEYLEWRIGPDYSDKLENSGE